MKKVYYEWMRIIACALVIFNHLAGYELYQISSGSKQAFYMVLTMITRINVPLFFMISGALLLKKSEDFMYVIKKRVLRILLIMLIFEGGLFFMYSVYYVKLGTAYDHSIIRFIGGFLAGNLDGTGSYWYLYAYLGFLLSLPFMQRIAKGMKKQDFIVLVILHFIFYSFIPLLNIGLNAFHLKAISVNGSFSVPLATSKAFIYPLLGYYLDNYVDIKKIRLKQILSMILVAGIGIYLSCWCTYYEGITKGSYTQNYVQLFDYLSTIVAFIMIKYIVTTAFPKMSERILANIIGFIGSLTFGIYLLDPYWKAIFYKQYSRVAEPFLPTLLVSIGWVIFSMCIGGLVTYILKKLPILKRIL